MRVADDSQKGIVLHSDERICRAEGCCPDDRAIEREPEAAQAFVARSEAYQLLGNERLAAVDRARAAYLGV